MPRCFVIQPFDDDGPYDKRYDDVLAPAVEEAGLEPYRVDRDPAATDLIDDIEKGIKDSDICLADITEDNPNIWYEVGFAFAIGKPVVLICSRNRRTRTPFDISPRPTIFYLLDSPTDFKDLATEITTRLTAQLQKAEAMQTIESLSPVKSTEGLSSYEIAGLVSITKNCLTPGDTTAPNNVRRDMTKAGYTELAASLALQSLSRKEMIEFTQHQDDFGNEYSLVGLTDHGVEWMLKNQRRFKLSVAESAQQGPEINDEDIPF